MPTETVNNRHSNIDTSNIDPAGAATGNNPARQSALPEPT
jgi:hypothetical protein